MKGGGGGQKPNLRPFCILLTVSPPYWYSPLLSTVCVAHLLRHRIKDDVVEMRQLLEQKGIKCWMDIDNMKSDIYDSMAEGVQGKFSSLDNGIDCLLPTLSSNDTPIIQSKSCMVY